MNVYDWDKTVYDGDSSIDFYKYILAKNKRVMKLWPKQLRAGLRYKMGKITKTEMKTVFYEYFQMIDDIEKEVEHFWALHQHKIKDWYLDQKRDDDLIISASPEFLLRPITETIGVRLIASDVDEKTGKNLRENCYGKEKVVRFNELYENAVIEEFYSDSYSDDPVAQLANKSFMVKGDERIPW